MASLCKCTVLSLHWQCFPQDLCCAVLEVSINSVWSHILSRCVRPFTCSLNITYLETSQTYLALLLPSYPMRRLSWWAHHFRIGKRCMANHAKDPLFSREGELKRSKNMSLTLLNSASCCHVMKRWKCAFLLSMPILRHTPCRLFRTLKHCLPADCWPNIVHSIQPFMKHILSTTARCAQHAAIKTDLRSVGCAFLHCVTHLNGHVEDRGAYKTYILKGYRGNNDGVTNPHVPSNFLSDLAG